MAESQLQMLQKLMLPYEDFAELKRYAEQKGIEFLSTPFDIESADVLHDMGLRLWKIPSGEITNYPYLVHIAGFGEPVILSTGMCTLEEVRAAMELLREHGCGTLTLLHCTTQYPTPYEDVNLRAMLQLRETFGCAVGYSDHTKGIEVPIAAVAMGATVIEKHFTLDRTLPGPDHAASLEPDELAAMVAGIRHIEQALGDGDKKPAASELANQAVARKSIVARCAIRQGELFTEENLTTKRPGDGVSAMRWPQILGKKAIRDFAEDELIELGEDVSPVET